MELEDLAMASLTWGERGEIFINRVGFMEFTDNFTGIFVGLMGRNGGKLFDKGVRNT